jgi:DNA-binding MarR family transcriptional regulator
MTSSMSGFLGPEEEAVLEKQNRSVTPVESPSNVSLAILQTLVSVGSLPTGELLSKLSARPREIVAALDELESAGQVRLRATDADEVVELTDAGRSALTAHTDQ